MVPTTVRRAVFVLAAMLPLVCEAESNGGGREFETPIATSPINSTPRPIEKSPMKDKVPQETLDPILNEAATRAHVPREQLVIVRAESVVWNDASLGCHEPGMRDTQALVNGYWGIIKAAGQNDDFC